MTGSADRMSLYLGELYRWNRRINLTSVDERDAEEVLVKPSMAMLEFINESPPVNVMDIGSGGGVPAIILAICRPVHSFFLVESNKKKSAFLSHVCATLKLSNARVLAERVEAVAREPLYAGKMDVITSRAVRAGVVLDAAADLLAPGGKVLLHRSTKPDEKDERFKDTGENRHVRCLEKG